jgi:hypothetical protein
MPNLKSSLSDDATGLIAHIKKMMDEARIAIEQLQDRHDECRKRRLQLKWARQEFWQWVQGMARIRQRWRVLDDGHDATQ